MTATVPELAPFSGSRRSLKSAAPTVPEQRGPMSNTLFLTFAAHYGFRLLAGRLRRWPKVAYSVHGTRLCDLRGRSCFRTVRFAGLAVVSGNCASKPLVAAGISIRD